MGVQGLQTFIEKHQRIYLDVQFQKRRLVIDGCNLLYLLYFDSGLDQNHGGEYAAFEDLIEEFIRALRVCEISPYVVLDGGSDHTDKKLETTTRQAEDRIQRAHRAAESGDKEDILPPLVKEVFRQTLTRLEVPLAQCYAEADEQVAALAREWACPVLSSDSDFYVFDLPAGLLPLRHFHWRKVEQRGSGSFIPCKSYRTSSFCLFFNTRPQLLPTFAALAGNDYVKWKPGSFIGWTQFCPAGGGKPSRLEGLLCWLRSFQGPQEAVEAALVLMGELSRQREAEVRRGLDLGMKEYRIPPSYLKNFFSHGTAPPFPAEQEEVAARVPDWIRLPLIQGRLTPDFLDVLILRRRSLGCPVDHADKPSAQLTSRPIRQVVYGLLLGGGSGGPVQVQERDRDGLQLICTPVEPVFTTVPMQLPLNSPEKVAPSLRLQVFLEALGVTEASLSRLLPELRLPVAVTCYWLKRARPRPDQTLLKALLLGLSNGDSLRHGEALQSPNPGEELDVDVVHALNQWQSCLKDSVHLNQLLGLPLADPQIARLYAGTLLHHLVRCLRTHKLRSFLRYDHDRMTKYKNILAVIQRFQGQNASSGAQSGPSEGGPSEGGPSQGGPSQSGPSQGGPSQSGPSQGGPSEAVRRRPLSDMTVNLQQLFQQGGDEEEGSAGRAMEDLRLDELLSVKTRYRAKERKNRCKNPELVRKDERRGRSLL